VTDEQPTTRRAAREAAQGAGKTKSVRTGAEPQPTGADAPRSGIGALLRKHPTAWLLGALGLVFVLLGAGAVYAGSAIAAGADAAGPAPTPTVEPPRPTPSELPAASRLRTCSVAALATDPRLMSFQGSVVRADTGEVLFDRGGTTPARTASVLKVLTAAAALAVLGPDYQISTTVVEGSTPGTIVLIGRGDATLSALPAGAESVYRGAPKLATLAAQVVARYAELHPDVPITQIVLDASYWSAADKWDPSWKRSEQTIGYHSEVTALQVDGDRADPTRTTSPRSTDPIGRAGQAFRQALFAADPGGVLGPTVTISTGTALGGTQLLGEVKSQPVSALVDYMLLVSDNTLAEMLARITSKQSALNGSAASLQQAIPSALSTYGIPTEGMVIRDGSGLSEFNAVSPLYVSQLMVAVAGGTQNLAVLREGLPVAGESGSLAGRFTGDNAVARGAVFAKTGWIDTSYSLGGFVNAADGTQLTFAFYAIGDGIRDTARAALDTLTTGIYRCGDNLSNN
jgi:D-alanyl-D-alanine carboxypeptidase/D-alanyl-D-alanine-endopeptidase (penicillin-binding protein 4)